MSGRNETPQMGSALSPDYFGLMTDEFFQCPFPAYERMHREAPVFFYEPGGFFVVSKMADVRAVLLQPNVFSSEVLDLMGMSPALRDVAWPQPALLFADPPEHANTRTLVDRAFTGPRVKRMEGRIQAIIDELLDEFIDEGAFDVSAQLAVPLPIDFIGKELDVPRSGRDRFREWSEALASTANLALSTIERDLAIPMIQDANAFLLAKRAEKRIAPTDDLISSIVTASEDTSTDGGRLSDGEFLTVAQLIVVAGNENTAAGILACVHAIAKSPALLFELQKRPELIPNFVEEVLRLESPASGFVRVARKATEINGFAIPEGGLVHVRYAAANRDATIFGDPEILDLHRPNRTSHIAFGAGVHACIGQMLARMEIQCVIRTLCSRMASIEVSGSDDSHYLRAFHVRTLNKLNVRFTTGS